MRRLPSSNRKPGASASGLITASGSINPISRIDETIWRNLRVVMIPAGAIFEGISSLIGI